MTTMCSSLFQPLTGLISGRYKSAVVCVVDSGRRQKMKKRLVVCALGLAVVFSGFAQKKEGGGLANSAHVLRQLIAGDLPKNILDQADCVVIFPSVKKVAIGIGG